MADIQHAMARQFIQIRQHRRAEAILKDLIFHDPSDVEARILMARIFAQDGELGEAIRECTTGLQGNPNGDQAHRIGRMLQGFGDLPGAANAFRAAIAVDPQGVDSYLSLALVADFAPDSPEIGQLKRKLQEPDLNANDKKKLNFALGKIWDDLGHYDRAFLCFKEANTLARDSLNYSSEQTRRTFDAIVNWHSAGWDAFFPSIQSGDKAPIFIFGLPRSGSTLTEQILASHSEVTGAGELGDFSKRVIARSGVGEKWPFDPIGPDTSKELARGLQLYLKTINGKLNKTSRVIDKRLMNFMFVGFIASLLPNATLIECRRDMRDQCLSIYQKDFSQNFPWSCDFRELGNYCGMYIDLMSYWRARFPGRIFTAKYEDLIDSPEENIRKLLAHCNLRYEAACLKFHETEKAVHTLSASQVRKPLYKSSVGRWKNYRSHIKPLLRALPEGLG